MPLDIWMTLALLALTVGSFVYVVALRKLPWCGDTSHQVSSPCWSRSTCSLPFCFRSGS